ncbi:MAG: hypothetical protein KGQ49_07175 [Verrucomicrobia bacterium]|nr:hypothetical protein [Verrucomicrobiota bacterium]MBU6447164.1 hypothetical protein [Verrucomicrobiota bacterium]MDE3047388.1 hypothetical protein [Verrucomicrobiota bacterium]
MYSITNPKQHLLALELGNLSAKWEKAAEDVRQNPDSQHFRETAERVRKELGPKIVALWEDFEAQGGSQERLREIYTAYKPSITRLFNF